MLLRLMLSLTIFKAPQRLWSGSEGPICRRGLANVKTRYVFLVDASVEFTHNTNLPRMKSMLDSRQVRVVSPMLENAATNELIGQCFDVALERVAELQYRYHSHELRIRRGYAGVFAGNQLLCERGAPYLMTNKETLKQLWPSERLPLTLAVEAFYLQLKSFEIKVGFCPGSILRFNSIEAYSPSREEDIDSCNVFSQPIARLDELSKK